MQLPAFIGRMFGAGRSSRAPSPVFAAAGDGGMVISTPQQLEQFLRSGFATSSGAIVTPSTALFNSAVFRAVNLISASIGMLPLTLNRHGPDGSIVPDTSHPLAQALEAPNGWQTAFEFRQLLQGWALRHGNGYAVVIRSMGRIKGFLPIHPDRVTVEQNDDLTLTYRVSRKSGGQAVYSQADILHLRDVSDDGVIGISRVDAAREAIGLSTRSEEAAARLFRNGMMLGGAISFANKQSPEARAEFEAALKQKYEGSENAHRWMVAEGGAMDMKPFNVSSVDAQHLETRKHQVEEIARFFGVPRPLLMIDETSWGSGIEQLATLFVRFGLAPWFINWEQAIARACLTPSERGVLKPDFDETELLRGSMKDQAEFFAKALGSGGSDGWMTPNEVRKSTGFGPAAGGGDLPRRQSASSQAPASQTPANPA